MMRMQNMEIIVGLGAVLTSRVISGTAGEFGGKICQEREKWVPPWLQCRRNC
ncbi:12884_t:CDS:2, partial [Acaulospora morrowiae]